MVWEGLMGGIPAGLYAAPTYSLTKGELAKMENTLFQIYRLILTLPISAPWEQVIQEAAKWKCCIVPLGVKLGLYRLKYAGHVERMPTNSLQRMLLHGTIYVMHDNYHKTPKGYKADLQQTHGQRNPTNQTS